MRLGLPTMGIRTILGLVRSWGTLFDLLDQSYCSSDVTLAATATSTSTETASAETQARHMLGAPQLFQELTLAQSTAADLVSLLQALVTLLDEHPEGQLPEGEQKVAGNVVVKEEGKGLGEERVPSVSGNLPLSSLRRHFGGLTVPVSDESSAVCATDMNRAEGMAPESMEKGDDKVVVMKEEEVEVVCLAEQLLLEVHSWTYNLVQLLATWPRPPPLPGVLTIDFSHSASSSSSSSATKGKDGVVKKSDCNISFNLRSE